MAEVIVVSAIVLIVMSTLFISYNKILSTYKTRINYNDMKTLNRLIYVRDLMIEQLDSVGNSKINRILDRASGQPPQSVICNNYSNYTDECIVLDTSNIDVVENNGEDFQSDDDSVVSEKIYIYNYNQRKFDSSILNNVDDYVNPSFRDYIDYLSESIIFSQDFDDYDGDSSDESVTSNYIMFGERCYTYKNNSYEDCKYAYLRIYNGGVTYVR